MIAAVTGSTYCAESKPRGRSKVSAASGAYAAEPSASRPKIGMPDPTPTRCAWSSSLARGLPNRTSITDIRHPDECEMFKGTYDCDSVMDIVPLGMPNFYGGQAR